MHSIEINLFLRQPKTIFYEPSSIQAHLMQPFAFKKKETVFYNITHQPAVTHILKTLLEHHFHDVKAIDNLGLYYTFWLKNLLAFIQALLMYNIKIDYMRNHFNFFCYVLLLTYQLDTYVQAKFLTGGKFFRNIFRKYLIIRQILQTCEISKKYLKPL